MITRNWWVLGAFLLPFNVALADIDSDLKGIDTMAPAGVTKAAATAAKNAIAEGMSPANVYEALTARGVPPQVAGQAVTQNLPSDWDAPENQKAMSDFENSLEKDGLVVDMGKFEVSAKTETVITPTLVDTGYYSTVGDTSSGAGGGGGGGVSEPASPF